ncbi:MAG: IS21 family transposase [Thermotogae bacterium]|jgi:transposase|nr:IS21 family transposase [Thermotogota bacterium]MCL5033029.1 IS21 family transposase [Thermotogota bacterium]
MLTQKQIEEISLLKEIGLSNRDIAQRVRCHENTVSKILKGKENKMKPSKLDPFKEYLKERISKYPKITSTILFKEIIQMGYTGKSTILYDYIRSIRPEPFEEYKRFETLPGEQFQVDWGEGKTIISGESVSIKYFVMVLGYSRMFYFDFVKDEKLSTLLECHSNAFEYFGGYCSEGLYDNMKTVVKELKKGKEYNEKFMDFANFYGFKVITHRPYNPQAKGKVERIVPFIRNNLLYAKEYSSISELENRKSEWLEEANRRVHSELKEIPLERFKMEKSHLHPLTKLYPIRYLNTRKVTEKGDVIYKNKSYQIGIGYANKRINLEEKGGLIEIYYHDKKINSERLKIDVEVRSLNEYEEMISDGL